MNTKKWKWCGVGMTFILLLVWTHFFNLSYSRIRNKKSSISEETLWTTLKKKDTGGTGRSSLVYRVKEFITSKDRKCVIIVDAKGKFLDLDCEK